MSASSAVVAALMLAGLAAAQGHVSFPTQDGGLVSADIYGKGDHGGGDGPPGGKRARPDETGREDVLAAVRYLQKMGATSVYVIGASRGRLRGEAAEAEPQEIDRLVLLAAGAYTPLTRMKGRKRFIMSRDDVIGDNQPRLPKVREQYEKAAGPKEFMVLNGSAHAQFIFTTDQGERLMHEILRFLSAR